MKSMDTYSAMLYLTGDVFTDFEDVLSTPILDDLTQECMEADDDYCGDDISRDKLIELVRKAIDKAEKRINELD